jgi:hypothetical protein
VDDLVGAQLGQAAGALRAGGDAGDVCAGEVGELHGDAADPAAGARDEHAAAQEVAGDLEGQEAREAGHRQARRLGEAHLVG